MVYVTMNRMNRTPHLKKILTCPTSKNFNFLFPRQILYDSEVIFTKISLAWLTVLLVLGLSGSGIRQALIVYDYRYTNIYIYVWWLMILNCWLLCVTTASSHLALECFHSLDLGDALQQYRTRSTLVHYLNQCWFIISHVLLHSQESKF